MNCPNPKFERHISSWPSERLEAARPALRRMASRGYWGPSTLNAVERELWFRVHVRYRSDQLAWITANFPRWLTP